MGEGRGKRYFPIAGRLCYSGNATAETIEYEIPPHLLALLNNAKGYI